MTHAATRSQLVSTPPQRGQVVMRYKDVTYAYPGQAVTSTGNPGEAGVLPPAIEGVTLDVLGGEKLGILGPNGGGKSTLLKLTLGLLELQAGEISVLGMTPEAARTAKVVGYVPQRVEAELSFPISVFDVVAMAAASDLPPWKKLEGDRRDAVLEALRLVGMADLAQRPIGRLSGGQVQRVMIARALAVRPRILLLDEPMVGIDVTGQKQFSELIDRLASELALTVVVVSHDLRTVAAGCDRVACLSRTLHCHVAPRGLTPQVLADVFRHDVAAIFGELHVDAHHADACADPSHTHPHPPHTHPSTPASPHTMVPLRIERETPPPPNNSGGAAL